MTRRRVFALVAVLAAVVTAWLLLGRNTPARADRTSRSPGLFSDLPGLDGPEPEGKAPAAPGSGDPASGSAGASAPGPGAPAANLRIRVVHPDGAPAGGATVEAYRMGCDSFPSAPPTASGTTGRDGTTTLSVVAGAPYRVRASRGDAANIPAHVTPGGPEAVLVLEPARALRGLVLLPEGGPAQGYLVWLTFDHAGHTVLLTGTTDDAGRFELAPLPDAWLDQLTVEVRWPGQMRLGDKEKWSGLPSAWEFRFGREDLRGGDVTLQLTVVKLHARVVGEDGTPVDRAMVHWAPPGAPDPPSFRFIAVTDADGRFQAALQRVAGEAFVIEADGYAPLVWRPEALPADRKMNVPEIVLRKGLPLAGRVTDPSGVPVVGASVRLEDPKLPGQVVQQGYVGDDGRFRFQVAEGAHVLYAFRAVEPDLCLPQLRMEGVAGGPDEVRVVLPEPNLCTVRFVAESAGDPVAVQHLTLIVRDARGAEIAKRTWSPSEVFDRVRFEVWEEGTYGIEVYTARHEPARVSGVKVVPGRTPDVAVPLVPRR